MYGGQCLLWHLCGDQRTYFKSQFSPHMVQGSWSLWLEFLNRSPLDSSSLEWDRCQSRLSSLFPHHPSSSFCHSAILFSWTFAPFLLLPAPFPSTAAFWSLFISVPCADWSSFRPLALSAQDRLRALEFLLIIPGLEIAGISGPVLKTSSFHS